LRLGPGGSRRCPWLGRGVSCRRGPAGRMPTFTGSGGSHLLDDGGWVMRTGILAVLILGLVVGCGGGNDAGTAAARGDGDGGAAAPAADKASRAPHAEAVARTVDYSSDTLETVERRYTDGIA